MRRYAPRVLKINAVLPKARRFEFRFRSRTCDRKNKSGTCLRELGIPGGHRCDLFVGHISRNLVHDMCIRRSRRASPPARARAARKDTILADLPGRDKRGSAAAPPVRDNSGSQGPCVRRCLRPQCVSPAQGDPSASQAAPRRLRPGPQRREGRLRHPEFRLGPAMWPKASRTFLSRRRRGLGQWQERHRPRRWLRRSGVPIGGRRRRDRSAARLAALRNSAPAPRVPPSDTGSRGAP